MLDSSQHEFRATELDLDLLSTPFKIQTNWHVITGASCSGKTTLLDQLADKGFQRLPYQQDGVRAGDDATAAYFESWTSRDYSALGYNVIRVPVLSPEERLAFILERLSEQGVI